MSLSNKENLLNAKYDFLRRSVISYYAYCLKEQEKYDGSDYNVSKHDSIPCEFPQLMQFVKDLFYTYLQDEYKEIIK